MHRMSDFGRPRPRCRRAVAGLAYVVAGAAVVAGCGSSSSSSTSSGSGAATQSASSKKLTTVTINYPAPVADHMFAEVTSAAGLFAKYGIKVKLTALSQTTLFPAMENNQIQFTTLAAPGYEVADLNGQKFQAIMQFENSFDSLLVSNAKYPTPKSLNGQAIAISSPGAYSDLLTQMMEKKYGISVHEEPLGANTNTVAALESGAVAAKPDVSPSQLGEIKAKLPGAHTLVDWRSLKGVPAIMLVGYGPWMQAHRQTTIDVVKALNAGFAYYKSHPTQTIATIAKVTQSSMAEAKAGYEASLKTLSSTTIPSLAAEKQVLNDMKGEYSKAASFNPANAIDTSYDQAAGAKP